MVEARPTTKLTHKDYLETPDDERWELLNGELVMAPSPRRMHQDVSGNLYFLLRLFVDQMGLGRVYAAPFDVVLSETNVVQPDLLFVSDQREAILTDDNVTGAPDSWWLRYSYPPQRAATGESNWTCTPSMALGSTGWSILMGKGSG